MIKAQTLPKVRLSKNLRRASVGLQYALLIGSTVLMLLSPLKQWDWIMPAIFILAVVASAAIHTTLALSIDNICQGRLNRLDERERTMRDQAFVSAFQILTGVLSVAWIYAMMASFLGGWLPEQGQTWMLLWSFAMLTYGLPTSVAAFNMPQNPNEAV